MLPNNKQTLILLKKRQKTLESGHKLLNEKKNILINIFLDLCTKGAELEKRTVNSGVLENYYSVVSLIDIESLIKKLKIESVVNLKLSHKKVAGIQIQEVSLNIKNLTRNLKPQIQTVFHSFNIFFETIFQISLLKQNTTKIASAIIQTNRQILNLEKKIEQNQAQIKHIKQALSEKENAEKAVMIKIFT